MFCDASQYAYAAIAYLKVSDTIGTSKTSTVTGKSRAAPQATIHRLELKKIVDLLSLIDTTPYFWTDSMCALRYIQSTRFAFQDFCRK